MPERQFNLGGRELKLELPGGSVVDASKTKIGVYVSGRAAADGLLEQFKRHFPELEKKTPNSHAADIGGHRLRINIFERAVRHPGTDTLITAEATTKQKRAPNFGTYEPHQVL